VSARRLAGSDASRGASPTAEERTLRSVLITGASRGLGRRTAEVLVERGWFVYAGSRRAVEEVPAGPTRCPLALDVRDPASIAAAVARIGDERGGRLDAVVHQAGIAVGGCFEDVPEALGRQVFETNVFGLLAVTRAALPLLRANGRGRVVAVSSSAGAMGSPGISWYVASKWAVEGWAESAALELATVGVDLLVVEPGPYRTEIFRASERVIPAGSAYRELAEAVERHVDVEVARQARDPSEVAERIARLLDAPRPRFRTPIGPQAQLAWGMRGIVPWAWRRRLVQRVLGPAARPRQPAADRDAPVLVDAEPGRPS
jgi:NAD(P)-dependent dehydrogenase (short-subunit alcohol dehydrogenase family)